MANDTNHEAEHARLLNEKRRILGEHRLLEAYFAFTDVVMADQYLPPERKVEIMKALTDVWPTPEEYAALPWQPGLDADGKPLEGGDI